jgi:16S rRNA (cytosine1402-N4)-methyltransferase
MRFGPEQTVSAADIVNKYSEAELGRIIYEFGEERHSRQIAQLLVRARPIHTTDELAALIESAMPIRGRIHPATKTFQALRIAVNQELSNLSTAMDAGIDQLGQGGRFSIISFHSLEDRIVKETFRSLEGRCQCPPGLPVCQCQREAKLRVLTRKPLRPEADESEKNPRARSARLRTAEKI